MSDLLACEVAYPHPYHGWDELPYLRVYHVCPGVPANDVVVRWCAANEASEGPKATEIDEAGKRDLNAALEQFTKEYALRPTLADSPMGNFIKGFYAARGWNPRERGDR
jgi:hypothetical protein